MSIRSLLLGMLAAVTPLLAQEPSPRPGEIATSGSANLELPATSVAVMLTTRASGRTPAEAADRVARQSSALQRALLAVGVSPDSIVTRRANVDIVTRDELRDTTYVASNSIQVLSRTIESIGRIIDTALVAGAQGVGGLSFYRDDAEAVYLRLLRTATLQARARAEAMAAAAGGRLGRLISSSTDLDRFMAERILDSPNSISLAGGIGSTRRMAMPVFSPTVMNSARVMMRWEFVPTP